MRYSRRALTISLCSLLLLCLPKGYTAEENHDPKKAPPPALLFAGRSCGSCEPIETALRAQGVTYSFHNIDRIEDYKVLVQEEKRLGIDADELPALIYGETIVFGHEAILAAIPSVSQWQTTATSSPKVTSPPPDVDVDSTVRSRFDSYGVWAVAAMGLVDGINPCAFATVIFLVGCLTGTGRDPRKALAVGLSFTAGVFLTYFLVGIGFYHALFALQGFRVVRFVFHYAVLTILAVSAVLAFVDAILTHLRSGKPLFKMPDALRSRANMTMARGLHTNRWILGGLALGSVVSLLELACTGQVLLPTIMYVVQTEGLALRAYGFLLLYNFMFILPLLLVLGLCVRGLSSERLWSALRRHGAVTRAMVGLLFLLMFLGLLYK